MAVEKSNGHRKITGARAARSPQAAPQKAEPQTADVASGRVQYLISVRPGANLHPAATDQMFTALQAMPDVEIVHRIQPSGFNALSLDMGSRTNDVIVIQTTPQRGLELQTTADPSIAVEQNRLLQHLAEADPQFFGGQSALPTVAPANVQVQVKVVDDKRQPLEKAEVLLFSGGFPVQQETDANGLATLTVYGGTIDTIQALYVKPFADFWEKWIVAPALSDTGVNTVSVQPLSAFAAAGFGSVPFLGWGQRLMGLGAQGGTLTGQGAQVAIADSGCDNKHPALTHVKIGRDFTHLAADGTPDQGTWTVDTISHGTHCAGIITGNGTGGILGFAPAATTHILKLFPGGAFDSLISAIKYAIDNQIDVVNCSLGSDQGSQIVQQWMEQARQAGVAVIVAAGNSAGPVQFPASLPNVLAVSAIGQQGKYPPDTYHAKTMPSAGAGVIGVNGIFAANFSCFGTQVRVCAPGVAIISSVPGGGYAAWDGTSMATPHITGLAALVAAHHPDIKGAPRNAARVDRLFQIVVAAAMPVGLNPVYGGAGLPSVSTAFQPSYSPQSFQPQSIQPQPFITADNLRNALWAAINQYHGVSTAPGARPWW